MSRKKATPVTSTTQSAQVASASSIQPPLPTPQAPPVPPAQFDHIQFELTKAQIQREYKQDLTGMQLDAVEVWGEVKAIKDKLDERIFQQRCQWAAITAGFIITWGGLIAGYFHLDAKIDDTKDAYIEKLDGLLGNLSTSIQNLGDTKELLKANLAAEATSKIENNNENSKMLGLKK